MTLACRKPHMDFNSLLGHNCAPTDRFSRMWGYDVPEDVTPQHAPVEIQEALDKSEWQETIAALFKTFYDLKHGDIAPIAVHREECDDEIEQLTPHFFFRNSRLVCEFLQEHRLLAPVLLEARKRIESHFGAETLSDLEVFIDPEDSDSSAKLFARILTTLPFEDASARLDRLDEEWWLDQSDEVRRLANIGVEYVDAPV